MISVKQIAEYIQKQENMDCVWDKWSVGAHMEAEEAETEVTKQIIFTSYHPLENFKRDKRLIFLTEVITGNQTEVKVLSDSYVHRRSSSDFNIGQHDPGKAVNILILELHEEVHNLLQNKVQFCQSDEKEFKLQMVHVETEPSYTSISKRGSATGITYGDVIAREVHLQRSAQHGVASAGFAVGSTSVQASDESMPSMPFGTKGDSGSLAFEKSHASGNVLILKAHGIIWKNVKIRNNHTREWDHNATFCAKLKPNLETIKGKPYKEFEFPGSPSGKVSVNKST